MGVLDFVQTKSKLTRRNRLHITTILRELGVECDSGNSLFNRNEGRLEYIFFDFQKAARRALAAAHPDLGGDTEEFQNLLANIEMVRRSFASRGIGGKPKAFDFEKERQRIAKDRQKWKLEAIMYHHLHYLMRKDAA